MFELPLLDELENTVDEIFFLQDHISSFIDEIKSVCQIFFFSNRNGKFIIFSLIEMMNFIGEFKPIEFLTNMTHLVAWLFPFLSSVVKSNNNSKFQLYDSFSQHLSIQSERKEYLLLFLVLVNWSLIWKMEYGPRPQRISLQYGYIRTLPGALKVIQFVNIDMWWFSGKK